MYVCVCVLRNVEGCAAAVQSSVVACNVHIRVPVHARTECKNEKKMTNIQILLTHQLSTLISTEL